MNTSWARDLVGKAAATLVALVASGTSATVITPNYIGDWTVVQQEAFYHAANFLADYLPTSYAGEAIVVDLYWQAMGTDANPDTKTLASSSPIHFFENFGSSLTPYRADTVYAQALANHLHGSDLSSDSEIGITFNSRQSWLFPADPPDEQGDFDFITIAMHEMMHGLGFFDSIGPDGGSLIFPNPGIWEWFIEGDLMNGDHELFAKMTDQERYFASRHNVRWVGAWGQAGNGGAAIDIYSPLEFNYGSSLSHLDPGSFADSLMRPSFGRFEQTHVLTAVERGMLRDIGWVSIPEPSAVLLVLIALVVLRRRHGWRAPLWTASAGGPNGHSLIEARAL